MLSPFVITNVGAQDGGGPFYLNGAVYQSFDGEGNHPANGSLYIWYDFNNDGSVDYDLHEFETVIIDENGEWVSKSQYGAGLHITFQTHTLNDYVETFDYTVPYGSTLSPGDTMGVPAFYVRSHDTNHTIRLYNDAGYNLLYESVNLTTYGTHMGITTSFHVDQFSSLGQDPYYDIGAQRECAGWALAFFTTTGGFIPDSDYDYAGSTPTYQYYYFLLDTIEGGVTTDGNPLSIRTEWDIISDGSISIFIVNPLWLENHEPSYISPLPDTIEINDWMCSPISDNIPMLYRPAATISRTGGAIFYGVDDVNYCGGVIEDDYPLDDVFEIIMANPMLIVSMAAMAYIMSDPRRRRKYFGFVFGSSTYHKSPPKKPKAPSYPEPSTHKRTDPVYHDPIIVSTDGDVSCESISQFSMPEPLGMDDTPLIREWDFNDWEDAYDNWRLHREGFDTYSSIALMAGVTPSAVAYKFHEIELTRPEPMPNLDTDVSHVPPPVDGKVWIVECQECGAPAEVENLKYKPSLGMYWECGSCKRVNVIEGTKNDAEH
jgi:hypothetical protein